jgi:hypothetical protein
MRIYLKKHSKIKPQQIECVFYLLIKFYTNFKEEKCPKGSGLCGERYMIIMEVPFIIFFLTLYPTHWEGHWMLAA